MCKSIDSGILNSARGGDSQAMAAVIAAVTPEIVALVKEFTGSGFMTAGDLTQEGLLGAVRAVYAYDSGKGVPFESFVRACARNSVLSALRSQGRKKHGPLKDYVEIGSLEVSAGVSSSDPEELLAMRERMAAVFDCIQTRLTPLEREVLYLRMDDLSRTEISAKLGMNVRTVDNALARARKKIKATSLG